MTRPASVSPTRRLRDRSGRAPVDPAAAVRAGRRHGVCGGPASGSTSTTVRDLLFHLPRRYDDLREMRDDRASWLGEDGTVVSVQATVGDVRVEPGFRRPDPAHDRAARGRHRAASTRPGSAGASSSAGCRSAARSSCPGKVKHFGRKLTLDNPEFQVVAERRRGAPCRPDRAGLPADGRADRGAPAGRRSARRSTRPATPTRSTCRRVLARGAARADRPGHRGGPLPGRRSRAATPRCGGWPSTSCSRSSSAWSARRRQRVRDAAPQIVDRWPRTRAVRTALVDAIGARLGAPSS